MRSPRLTAKAGFNVLIFVIRLSKGRKLSLSKRGRVSPITTNSKSLADVRADASSMSTRIRNASLIPLPLTELLPVWKGKCPPMGNSRCKNQARAPESGRWRLNALCSSNGSSLCVGSYIQVPAYPVLSTHIEQFTFAGVKRVMNRIRVMLGSLLPALWLSATGYCLLDSISDYEDDRQDASIFATRPENRLPIQARCSITSYVKSD